MHRKNTTRKAFTLSEATLVLAILGVIAALGVGVLRYMNASQFPTMRAVFKNDLATSLAAMNLDESIATSIHNTKELIEKGQEYYDFSKEKPFDEAFAESYKDAAGDTVDMKSHFGTGGDNGFYVFKTDSGASVAVKYVPNNNIDLESFAESTSKIDGADASYEVSNKTLNFVTGFYDVNGPEGPNKIGEDVSFIMPAFVLNKDLGEYLTLDANGAIVRKDSSGKTTELVSKEGVFNNSVKSTVTSDPDCPPGTVSDGTDVCACPYNDTYCQERGKKFDKENCGCRNANDETECTESGQSFDSGTGRCVCLNPGNKCGRYSLNAEIGDYNNCTCKCNTMSKLTCLNNLMMDRKCTWNDTSCEVTCEADAYSHCAAKIPADKKKYANNAVPDANNFCSCQCAGLKITGKTTECDLGLRKDVLVSSEEVKKTEPVMENGKEVGTKEVCDHIVDTYAHFEKCIDKYISADTLANGCAKVDIPGSPYEREQAGSRYTKTRPCGVTPPSPPTDDKKCAAVLTCPKDYKWVDYPTCKCEYDGPDECTADAKKKCMDEFGAAAVFTDDCKCINCSGDASGRGIFIGSTWGRCALTEQDKRNGKSCIRFEPSADRKECRVVYDPKYQFSPCDTLYPGYRTGLANSKMFPGYKTLLANNDKTVFYDDQGRPWVATFSNEGNKIICKLKYLKTTCLKHCGYANQVTLYKGEICEVKTFISKYRPYDKITGNNPKEGTVLTEGVCTPTEYEVKDPVLLIIPSTGNPADGLGVPTMLTENSQAKFVDVKLTNGQTVGAQSTWLAAQNTPKFFFLVKQTAAANGQTPTWDTVLFTDIDEETGLVELRKKDYDQNGDGVVNEVDPAFSTLKLWVDKNGNAKIDAGELASLKDKRVLEISTKYFLRSVASGEVEQSKTAVTALTGSFKAAIRELDKGPAYTKAVERTTTAVPGKVLYQSGDYFYEFNGSSYILRYRKVDDRMVLLTAYSGDHPLRNIAPANIAQYVVRDGTKYRVDDYKIIDIMLQIKTL